MNLTWLFEATLTLFFVGFLFQDLYLWLPPVNRLLGAFLALLAISSWLQRRGRIPAEVALFCAFIAWGVLTGFLFARQQSLVLAYGRQLIQELVLLFALAEYATVRRAPTFAFLLLLVASLGLWWYAYGTGQLAPAQAGGVHQRAVSFTSNPNYLGILCLYGSFGTAYFLWNRTKSKLVLWPLITLPFIGATLLASGSRKSILSVGVFALTWAAIAYGRTKASRTKPVLVLLMVAAILFLAGRYVMESTSTGERFRQAARTPHVDVTRHDLYQEGWTMFLRAPFHGVGLGNFVEYSSVKGYAHSDYMEVLATTGAVGFLLYYSIYLVLWLRLRRVLKKRSDVASRYAVGLYQAIVITSLLVGLGRPNFLDPLHLYIVGVMVGHACAMEQDLRSTRPAESGARKDVTSPLPVAAHRASRSSL